MGAAHMQWVSRLIKHAQSMLVGATHAQWMIIHAQVSIGILYVQQIGEGYA